MAKQFPALNSPFNIGMVTIKNRFVMAPVTTGSYLNPDGSFSPAGIEYFVRRAQGGMGLLQTGALTTDTEVDATSSLGGAFRTSPAAFLATSDAMLNRTRAYGAKFFVQLTLGLGRNAPGLYGPSENPVFGAPNTMSPALTVDQIHRKVEQLVEAAGIAKQAGFDGVEVHSIHWGYLLDQFASALTNRREDEYGGTLENRLRVSREIVEGIKQTCGEDFPVTMRLGLKSYAKDFMQASFDGEGEKYRTLEEGVRICQLLESYGYDALDVDTGVYDSFYYACPPMYLPRGYMVELAEKAKGAVGIPVIVGSRMGDVQVDERAIEEGKFDAVALGRPMMADPDLPRKVQSGRADKIRPCIACNQGCLGRLFGGLPCGCAVNPEVGREGEGPLAPAPIKKHVVVVGGGVAGMEAARTARRRGHDVTLLEQTDALGGHLLTGGAHDFKVEVRELNAWYQGELADLGVDVRMGVEATPELIDSLGPDAVVLAAGSVPVMPPIEGADNPKCVGCVDALRNEGALGQHVVVVGGGLVGCELALDLINKGREVEIVEALPAILSSGIPVPLPNMMYLNDAFAYHGTPVHTSTKIVAVTDEGAVVESVEGGERSVLAADSVVIAVGFKSRTSMASELVGRGYEVYEVGDGRQVGNILTSIWDAYEVAHAL